ncbi:MAG: sugar transferase, partial [Erysipelotrichaceae bacterium]|nr:sugar transferase [Erysipelotrichaceae bacterium]
IIFLLVKLFTFLESPGPVLVKRVRVGKNNIPFTQYRFRTFRADAGKRSDEGKDPHTFIGKIIEALHLDGLPLVLNVLSGDMSLIGPKAPNLPKYLRMSVRERNLLSIRPGIIGFWTTEQDQSKALNDETEYLENWTIFKDIAILFYCILRYVGFHSLRVHGDTHTDEEYAFAAQISRHNERIVYDRSLYTLKENALYGALKRLLDVIISLVSLIVFSPVFLILVILVIAYDGGSPFYTHERIGKDGRKIDVFKFRSMRMDAGNLEDLLTPEQLEQYRKEFKIDDDPRITKIGEFIRRSSLDELPQLLNIFTGEMSFVGPRPIVESELYEHYTEEEIAKILSVRPGLTGYWQAYARNNAEYETHERQDMELYYVDHRSFFFDVKIFFRTFYAVFKNDGAQ